MPKVHYIHGGTLRTFLQWFVTVFSGRQLRNTGIGLLDVQRPLERQGRQLIDMAGFQFHGDDRAVRRIDRLGFRTEDMRHIVLTHGDPDHAGGLVDFPNATVHTAAEELANCQSGHWRYISGHFEHQRRWQAYPKSSRTWFGLEARPVAIGLTSEVLLLIIVLPRT